MISSSLGATDEPSMGTASGSRPMSASSGPAQPLDPKGKDPFPPEVVAEQDCACMASIRSSWAQPFRAFMGNWIAVESAIGRHNLLLDEMEVL